MCYGLCYRSRNWWHTYRRTIGSGVSMCYGRGRGRGRDWRGVIRLSHGYGQKSTYRWSNLYYSRAISKRNGDTSRNRMSYSPWLVHYGTNGDGLNYYWPSSVGKYARSLGRRRNRKRANLCSNGIHQSSWAGYNRGISGSSGRRRYRNNIA